AEPGRVNDARTQRKTAIFPVAKLGIDPAEKGLGIGPAVRTHHGIGAADISAHRDVGKVDLAADGVDLARQRFAGSGGGPISFASLRHGWRFAILSKLAPRLPGRVA